MKLSQRNREISVERRVVTAFVFGVIAAAGIIWAGLPALAPITLFDVSALVYAVWTWSDIWPMNATTTAAHALREDNSRLWTDIFLIAASLVSLVAVGFLVAGASSQDGSAKLASIGLGVISVIISWALVHTIFALRYAHMYYGRPEGGIDFNEKARPAYSDFAYLAVTIGMTYQVSDTEFETQTFRKVALRHALLSYLFGTVVVATTINLVAGLSK
ncbi:MAG: hypothetical protein JWQ20_4655 [Conexibacter sp.]|nr:hypothetical protein [Conexibacter sp.]